MNQTTVAQATAQTPGGLTLETLGRLYRAVGRADMFTARAETLAQLKTEINARLKNPMELAYRCTGCEQRDTRLSAFLNDGACQNKRCSSGRLKAIK